MKVLRTISIITISIFSISSALSAQELDLKTVTSEIKAAALKEQNAFKKGDCAQVLEMMEDNITFLANGRKVTSKKIIQKFCNSIPRPFKTAHIDTLAIYPLSKETGYSIKTLEYRTDEDTKTQEYVTKIWRKTNGQWKISHLHSTVKKVPINN